MDIQNEVASQTLSETQERVLHRAITMLSALPVKYYVLTQEGAVFQRGELTVSQEKSHRRGPRKYPHREMLDYVLTHVEDMKPGDVVSIPVGAYTAADIGRSAGPWAQRTWGKGSYTSSVKRKGFYEIMRVF